MDDAFYMKRALELAKKGAGYTSPNPLVGAVIVKDGKIIGEGYHRFYGGPHAEIDAFSNATQPVRDAVLYVNLEPCSHYGKTPPCAAAIVEKKIRKVVVAMKDPNPLVSGKGIVHLKKHGIEVVTGVLEEEARKLNEIFIKYITTKTPFCLLKTAMTLDGKIAAHTGDSKWITGEASRKAVHELRHRFSAIMVGIQTVLADNPLLTTRLENKKGRNPVRIIVDSRGRIPLEANVLQCDAETATIIATTEQIDGKKKEAIEKKGARVLILPSKEGKVSLKDLMRELGRLQIDSVLLEGGSTLNASALQEGIVDKVAAFIAPKILGGENAKTPVGGRGKDFVREAFRLENIRVETIGEDILIEGDVRKEESTCLQDL